MRIKRSIYLSCLAAVVATAADTSTSATFPERDVRYRIRPTDVIEIKYRYTPEFNHTAAVQPDGFVSLPLVGDMKVSGLSVKETEAMILRKASERLANPEITVVLKEFEQPYFVVGGEVGNPGRFNMRGRVTAVEAVAMAGGLRGASAKHSQVLWFHRMGDDLAETKILNLKTAVQNKNEDVELRSGDMLFVPQNKISKIERIIRWGSVGVFWNPLSR